MTVNQGPMASVPTKTQDRFRIHPKARIDLGRLGPFERVAGDFADGPEGGLVEIAGRPIVQAVSQLLAAIEAGRPFCVCREPGRGHPVSLEHHRGRQAIALRRPFLECETGGTTGVAKRIRRSQASWIASFEVNRRLWPLGSADTVAVFGTLQHSLPLYAIVEALWLGAGLRLLGDQRPDRQAEAFGDGTPTLVYASPTHLRQLALAVPTGALSPGVKRLVIGGGFLDEGARTAARRLFPQAEIAAFYGAAETSFMTLCDRACPVGSVGKPYPGCEIRIETATGGKARVGDIGTVWVASPYLFDDYAVGASAATRWEGRWLTVGELGWFDEAGNLSLAGRADRAFNVADSVVHPEALEALLLAQPGIVEAAVMDMPDARRGRIPVGFVAGQLDDGAIAAAKAACQAVFGSGAAPRRIVIVEIWPRLASGKTDYDALRTLASAAASGSAYQEDEGVAPACRDTAKIPPSRR
ncbi:AMP-binding protein [Jiella sp. MQZ9-1]|uniref:AMP-binding protein n=1 Tax=Jiella flava TaxID=2816857 RepID=A0A939FZK4_9HYPH|nr:AMP-binding protein [Jiella flava]MBO0662893.1 AMP-binding protein [Jiella flava]MCD2471347.1 AMP-binding protein [Jiella flava]